MGNDENVLSEKMFQEMVQNAGRGNVVGEKDILELFRIMTAELLVSGNSGLLNKSLERWYAFCRENRWPFRINEPISYKIVFSESRWIRNPLSPYDAYNIILGLSNYMDENIDHGTGTPEIWIENLGRNTYPINPDLNSVYRAFPRIDEYIISKRREIFAQAVKKKENSSYIFSEDREYREKAQKEADAILNDAKEKAAVIVNEAKNEARKEAGRKHQEELSLFSNDFAEVRKMLQDLNSIMRHVEETVIQKNTQKAFSQLFELYSMAADVRDAFTQRIKEQNNADLEDMFYNLETFMDMIEEYLADYGIDTIMTAPETPFDGKLHAAKNTCNFDPGNAVVRKSIRHGFIWGDKVLQKEQVTI